MAAESRRAPDGFAEFVAARSAGLLRSAWLLTGDAGKAEDLLQTVLAKAWRRWPSITSGGAPETARDGDLAAGAANRDAVRRALARLSRQQRAVVVLRYVEDFSVERTAELLGCSGSTVRVQASRAMKTLRADPHLRLTYMDEEVEA